MGAVSSNPQYPQSRPVYNVTEKEAGSIGSIDIASMEAPTRNGLFAFDFGAFVVNGANGYDKVASGSTAVVGPALIGQLSRDYANRKYAVDDVVAVGRRGYFM